MAQTIKILGQGSPAVTTLTDMYAVPAGKQSVISSITVCNTSAVNTDSFRIAIVPSASVDNIRHYAYRDVSIAAKETFVSTIGITLDQTDVVRAYSVSGSCAFTVFGSENDSSTSAGTISVSTGSFTYTGISALTFSGSVIVTNPATGVVSITPTGTGGGGGTITSINGDGTPAQVIAGGAGISVSSVSGTTTITNIGALGGYVSTQVVSSNVTQSMSASTQYIADSSAGPIYFTLPTTPSTGSLFRIIGRGSSGYKVAQSANQTIYFGIGNTTTGVSGSLENTHQRDVAELMYVSTNEFQVISAVGELTLN